MDLQNLVWSSEYAIGIGEMDEQHQNLFKIINDLIDLVRKEQHEDNLKLMSDFFFLEVSAYIHTHFDDETALMRQHEFPGLEEHLEQHQEISDRINQLEQDLEQDLSFEERRDRLFSVIRFMHRWVKEHTQTEDMVYGRFIRERQHATV
ncbi:bacteriohemerythrin [Magnetococcales bacterium HHB-1]